MTLLLLLRPGYVGDTTAVDPCTVFTYDITESFGYSITQAFSYDITETFTPHCD